MSQVDDHGRPEPPIAADETATLLGFLDYQRATLAWKCRGLDAAGLQATVGVSSMRSEEHTSELQSRRDLVCRLLLEKKKTQKQQENNIDHIDSELRYLQ